MIHYLMKLKPRFDKDSREAASVPGQSRHGMELLPLALVAVAGLTLAACSSSTSTPAAKPAKTTAPVTTSATVKAETTSSGKVLVTPSGMSLYTLTADTPTSNACTGACLSIWPPLTTTGTPKAGTGVTQSLLTTIPLPGGTTQVVYDGHPLSTFSGDTLSGQFNGEGLSFPVGSSSPKGHWYLVSPAGSLVTAKPTVSKTSTSTAPKKTYSSSSSGYGY